MFRCRRGRSPSGVSRCRTRWTRPPNYGDFEQITPRRRPTAPATEAGSSMLQGWVVVVVAFAYIGFLFLVASYGDRRREILGSSRARLLIYPLSLAIYCTSWTFFGSVGVASRTGVRFSDHLYRPGADGRPVLPADHPHRAARQGPEHHLDRRLHRRALRQEPGGRGDGRDDRHRRHDPLYRAAAQSGVVVGRNHPAPKPSAAMPRRGRSSAISRCSSRC